MGLFDKFRVSKEVEDGSHLWTGGPGDEFIERAYRTPAGGEWFLPAAEPFDVETGVTDLTVLTRFNEAAARFNAELRDPHSDLGHLEAAALLPDEAAAQRIRTCSDKLIEIIQQQR